MFRPLPVFIASRYSAARRSSWLVSFISLVTLLGMALGVMVLVAVVSVMNGFETELRNRMLSMISHATITSWQGELDDWQRQIELAEQHPQVLAAAPYIQRETLIRGPDDAAGALVRGIDPERERTVADIEQHLRHAGLDQLQPGGFGVILGRSLAATLDVAPGDSVTIFSPDIRVTPAGIMPTARRFEVVALLDVGMQQFDAGLALIHQSDASRLFRTGDQVTGLRLRMDDPLQSQRIAGEVSNQLGAGFRVEDWSRQNVNLFRAVAQERVMLFILLSLIIAVAGFNIVSALVMAVNDKKGDIAVLRTLGATGGEIMRIFVFQGLMLGIAGLVIGLATGLVLTWNLDLLVTLIESTLGIEVMSGDVYYISGLPVQVRAGDLAMISGAALLVSLLATVYPSWRAARVQPAEALRYE